MEQLDEQSKLRKYLLNDVSEIERSETEERLLTDDGFFEELAMAEENLIQDYADRNLAPEVRERFEKYFLSSEENREKVKFARALRKYVNENKPAPEAEKKPGFLASLKAFFSAPVLAAAVLIVAGIIGFLFWKNSSNDSEILTALNKAYKTERPVESRISDFEYAPAKNTRGGTDKTDKTALELAARSALAAVDKNPTAENLHSLGRVFLAEKEFDKAISQLEKAVQLAPDIAKIHNDLGVAFMEKARLQEEGKLEYLGKAMREFDKARSLDTKLIESLFNKAICQEMIPLPNEAKTTWQEYLKLDPDSKWADEARQHLEKLDSRSTKELLAPDFEQAFFNLYRQKKDEDVLQLISQNREMIKEKYLPQRLAMSFVNASPEERSDILSALKYVGNLEKVKIGDSFAADLADFYSRLSEKNIELTRTAQESVKKGYQLCLNDETSAALEEFTKAEKIFTQTGNSLEAIAVSRHFIAYCLYNIERRKEAVEMFRQVEDFCERRNYRWMQLAAAYWLSGWDSDSFDFHSTRKAKERYQAGLKISEEINDQYFIQKFLLTLALRSYKLRQEEEMLFYLQKLFSVSSKPEISLRQKFRNFTTSTRMLLSADFNEIAMAVVAEELNLANNSEEKFFIATAQIDMSTVQMQSGDFAEAQKWLSAAKQTSENLNEVSQKNDLLADIFLKLGNLERKKNNYREAAKYYDDSLKIIDTQKASLRLYEIFKSRLIVNQDLNNDVEVGNQIPAVIKLAEEYRSEILEEQERNSFFDNEQNIYDIAVEHQIRVGNTSAAFDYAEISNSRSLLDWLNKGISKSVEKKEILFNESTAPYKIEEIQSRMPPEVQILQYTVLDKKVLIWAVSKEDLTVVSSEIESSQLNEKVKQYLSLIQSPAVENQANAKKIGRELYDVLITPILPHLDKNKEICLIPNKILFQLPFATLLSPDEKFFLAEFSFFYAPSANVFILCTENADKRQKLADERLLSIGNPAFDRKEFADLQDLPASENEAVEISRHYGFENSKILLGKAATKKSVQELYGQFEIIHFAGHYVVQPNSPLSSGLILAADNDTGVLTNYELAGDTLQKTKLVVLSACQTGVEGFYNGEGLIGLSRTFLASGVPLVIASQWKVDSDAAAQLMENLHRYRRQEKLSSNNALRQAQLDMAKNTNNKFSAPYYWAAFASFGGYTKF